MGFHRWPFLFLPHNAKVLSAARILTNTHCRLSQTGLGLWLAHRTLLLPKTQRTCDQRRVQRDRRGSVGSFFGYGTDTTRAITDVCFSGYAAHFTNIRWIWSHGGGSMPFLAGRISGGSASHKEQMPNGMIAELKKMYYDLAGAAYAGIVASLRQLVTPDKILFGTDFPPGGHILEQAQAIRELKMFNDDELKLVERDNAVKLIPRLKNT
jgi:amidohydrolase family protein